MGLLPDYDDKARLLDNVKNETEGLNNEIKKKRKDIQGLRGIAILYVLIFHLSPKRLPYGYIGVDVFFVVSGFLITMILSRDQSTTTSVILNFFSKRIRRIFPAYFSMCFCVLIVAYYQLSFIDYNLLVVDVRWAITFTFNIHKYLQNRNYFADIANFEFMLHTWSLAVEIQFYTVAPFIVFIAQRGKIGKFFWISIMVSSFMYHLSTDGPLHFSSLPSRLWQFLIGGSAYLTSKSHYCQISALCAVWRKVILVLSLILISPLLFYFLSHEVILRVIVTVASAVIILLNDDIANRYILGNSILYFIGEVSYSLYLAHWPAIVFIKYATQLDYLYWKDAIFAAEISLIISILSYKFIENYFMKRSFLKTLIFLIAVTVGCIGFMHPYVKSKLNVTDILKETEKNVTGAGNIGDLPTRFEKYCYDFRDVPYLPVNVTEGIRQKAIARNTKFLDDWGRHSHARAINLTDPLYEKHFVQTHTKSHYMDYYQGNGSTSFIVFGNSYAQRAFYVILEGFGHRFKEGRLIATMSCQPFETARSDCKAFAEHGIELIEDAKPDIVFFTYRAYWETIAPLTDVKNDVGLKYMQNTIDRVSNVTKKIVLETMSILDPKKFQTKLLLSRLTRNHSLEGLNIPFRKFWDYYKYAFRRTELIKCQNCMILSLHKLFCNSQTCKVFDPDNLVSFFDGNTHPSDYARVCTKKLYRDTIDDLYAKQEL